MKKLITTLFLSALVSGCSVFNRSPESGYSSSGRATRSGWKRINTDVQNESFLNKKAENTDAKTRLKQLENGLSNKKELEQYSKALPWFHDEQEKIEFLELSGFEDRQKWLAEKNFTQRAEIFESKMKEVINAQDITLGMPEVLVKKAWGEPEAVEVSGNPQFRNFRWRYSKYISTPDGYKFEKKLVYFEGGKVVGWDVE